MESEQLLNYILQKKRETPAKVYITEEIEDIDVKEINILKFLNGSILIGELMQIIELLNQKKIKPLKIEIERKNSSLSLSDYKQFDARIEPGAIIREKVNIKSNAIIMMGAVINIGAEIGENSMVDMNSVIGSNAIIEENVHVGAGAVISGVLEPPGAKPCVVKKGAFIGANSVILEGVTIGKGAVVGAGAVVYEDVPDFTVVAGVPAKRVKRVDNQTEKKVLLVNELRINKN